MPSIINQAILSEVKTVVDASDAILFVDPIGLKADEALKLRKDLTGVGASMKVAKANIIRLTLTEDVSANLTGSGSLGMVVGEDIAAAAKVVRDLVKEEKVTVRGGLIEGNALDAGSALKLADLPSRHQLHGMLANVLAAPITGLARLLQELPTSLARVVGAIKEQKEG